MGKILIAFFSLAGETYVNGHIENQLVGNTETIAKKIHTLAGGDLFHIETSTPYPKDISKLLIWQRKNCAIGFVQR